MSLLKTIQRNRLAQVLLSLVSLVVLYFTFFRSSSSTGHNSSSQNVLTNEEVNNILSGDAASGSDIDRELMSSMSLRKPFLETGLKSDNWEVSGDTLIKNWDYVRLTSEKKEQAGLMFNKNGFSDDGFEVELNFSIHGAAKPNQLKADGFALFLTDKPLNLGTVFGAEDKFNGVGVFFDTYRNARRGPVFPYITVMNGDGHTNYDKANDGKANELAGCTARSIYNPKQGWVNARLIHTVEDGYLSLDYNFNGEWTNCFSIKNVNIPKQRYLGFGAATGDLVETVDLFEVQVYQLKQFGETIKSWNDFVEHIDEKDKEPETSEGEAGGDDDDDPDYEVDYKGRTRKRRSLRKKRNSRQRAKLQAKLRNKARRHLKFSANGRQETETNGLGFLGTLWWLVKTFILLLLVLVVAYVAFTVYRVKKRTWKSHRKTTGLLD